MGNETIRKLNEYDAFAFAFPLYVEGIPSQLLSCLNEIETAGIKNKNIRVYCMANCGFYEGEQNAVAVEILKNWFIKAGLQWGMAVGLGGGEAMSQMGENKPKGMIKSLLIALEKMKESIVTDKESENIYVTIDFPRWLYKIAG